MVPPQDALVLKEPSNNFKQISLGFSQVLALQVLAVTAQSVQWVVNHATL